MNKNDEEDLLDFLQAGFWACDRHEEFDMNLEELKNMPLELRLTDPRWWVREMDSEGIKELCESIAKTMAALSHKK